MSSPPSEAQLLSLAKQQLGYASSAPDAIVPAGYVKELKKHLEILPEDSNFNVIPQPGIGFGAIICLEEGCAKATVLLTKNEKLPDGGIKSGFGTLSAYRSHARSNVHKAGRLKRIKKSAGSSSSTLATLTSASGPKRLSILSALDRIDTPTGQPAANLQPHASAQAPRKRLSDGVPAGREDAENDFRRMLQQAPLPKRRKSDDQEEKSVLSPRDANVSIAGGFSNLENHAQQYEAAAQAPGVFGRFQLVKPEPSPDTLSSSGLLANLSQTQGENVALRKRLLAKPRYDTSSSDRSSSPAPMASSSKVQLDDHLPDPLQAALRGDLMYNLMEEPNGADDESDDDIRFDADGNYYGRGRDRFRGPVANPGDLHNFFLEAGNAEQFDGNASVNDALKKLKLSDLTSSFCGMKIRLMPHQAIGVAWMLEKEKTLNGGILADEMGLGKTVQMISTIMANKSTDPAVKTTLIIAPVALLDQWKLEIELKTNYALKCLIYHGASKVRQKKEIQKHDVVLTSFSTLALEWPDPELEEKKKAKKTTRKKDDFIASDSEEDMKNKKLKFKDKGLLLKIHWHRVVLDEAQNIKNKRTRISRAVTMLESKYKWCLTGTPITNSLTDAYPLLRFLQIRPWYDWDEFNAHVARHEVKFPKLATNKLQAIFASCLLRRKKDSLLDGKRLVELPDKTVSLIKLEFTEEEREVYRMVETRSQQIFNRYLRAGTVLKNYYQVLVMLLRLRQVCSHTSLITEDDSEDILIVDEDGDDTINRKEELFHVQTMLGREFVSKLKLKLKDIALERMEAEKKSADATIENEECPVCFDNMTDAVVTPCMHFFCRDCLMNVLATPHAADPDQAMKANERPCPACRSPVCREKVFSRKIFEPTDEELELIDKKDEEDAKPFKFAKQDKAAAPDQDEEMPDIFQLIHKGNGSGSQASASKSKEGKSSKGKGKGKGKAVKKRTKRAIIDSDEDEDEDDAMDSDDSLDDFIVHSDEDEEMKDDKKKLKRLHKRKPSKADSNSDSEIEETYDEVIIGPGKSRAERDIEVIKTLPKTLPSTKMMSMMESILKWQEEFPDEKVMVISQWTQCLDLVSNYLNTKEIEHVRYQGNMNREKRDKAVRAFMTNKRARIMLMSLKCGGVGLNLTRANRVISMDLGWSEAVESQAFDRVHRLGQERPVFVNRLVIQNTVEDRVLAMQERKKNLADGSLGEGNGKKIGRLSVRELANLFGLDASGRVLKP
ncbi:hypothetical protein SCHPADRAFT_900413 [Schizopora paradoxa]|uniref:P-loop containing nucleoside triphosphate hydrolase protein n=1 Tax=Schizopora paradoxa TaxID=27342 RepID=A0A0H2S002_9AGAM|nr:hypothetical protein SCHPADRAFT_900413 [Schizopora paradoxa]